MQDWNVVLTTLDRGYTRARDLLRPFGPLARTNYFNVLVMRVEDIGKFLADIHARASEHPVAAEGLSRVMPATVTCDFQSPEEFETKTKQAVIQWLPQLAGKTFHVRMHRHGFKERLSSAEEERAIAEFLLDRLQANGQPGRISFHDPDYLLEIVTVDQRAGLSLWSREDGVRYPLLRLARD